MTLCDVAGEFTDFIHTHTKPCMDALRCLKIRYTRTDACTHTLLSIIIEILAYITRILGTLRGNKDDAIIERNLKKVLVCNFVSPLMLTFENHEFQLF